MSTSSTAVDLSRLPPPTVVEQLSYEEILSAMIAELGARDITFSANVESDPVYKLLQVAAYRELLVRQNFNDRARGLMLAFARGADLDQLAVLVGVTRLVLEEADPLTGAAAVMESDDALRARVVLAPESFSVAGPELAYVFHAKSASGDVLDATATSPKPDDIKAIAIDALAGAGGTPEQIAAIDAAMSAATWPGEVIITVLSRDEDGTAAPELLETVEAVVNGRPVRPLTDYVKVQSATIVDYEIDATIHIFAGPDPTIVQDAAAVKLQAYVDFCHFLGRPPTLSGIYAALHVEGVQRVEILQPAADVVADETQAAWCTNIALTVAILA
ncbi:phage-related baseplate assembly protein [Sphingomonas zeicaulis]|uniref:baseplate assembly protein n=1 Tax=Sphingomonas zeicaulis TaxID=1632740 RepID=UPI003D1F4D1B